MRARVCVCLSVCLSVCVSVCLPPRPLITSGVIWCNIDRMRLVKQVLRLLITHTALAVNKMDGWGHFNTARSERLVKKTKVTQ